MRIQDEDDLRRASERIYEMGPRHVLIKGGHLEGPEAVDYLFDGVRLKTFGAERIDTKNTHGTGCTYSAALAAHLARGLEVEEAVARAKGYVTQAIRHSLSLGKGHGPLDHAWATRTSDRKPSDPA